MMKHLVFEVFAELAVNQMEVRSDAIGKEHEAA